MTGWVRGCVVVLFPVPEPVPQNFSTPEAEPDSITLAWSAPKDKNGVILGYRIVLYDTLRNETKEIVVNSSVATLDDLMPYTDYKAKIYPFTRKGEGNGSDFISVKTEEARKEHDSSVDCS